MTKSKKLSVAIVGLEHLHPRLYMPLFTACADTEVVIVCESRDDLREAFCNDYKVRGYSKLSDMLKNEQPDIAAIFLPHVECADAAVACAKRGIHLMVEKPIAASSRDAGRIAKAAEVNKVKFTTGYVWRLHPAAHEIKRLIESGAVGEIVGAEGRFAAGRIERYIVGNSPWMLERAKSGGGPMCNLGVHWIDLFRWLFAEDVVAVCGSNVKVSRKYDIEDNSFALMRFESGAIASLDISYIVPDSFPYGRDLYIGIRGTCGIISWAPAYEGEKDVIFVCSDAPSFAGAGKRHISVELDPVKGYSGWMGKEYVESFVSAVLKNTPVPIPGEEGIGNLKIVEAIYKADRQKKWVKV